jgi:hypothetical protein
MTHTAEHEPTEAEIQKAAYYLYRESGCLPGHETDHWFAAKELLRHRHGRHGTHETHQPPAPPLNVPITRARPSL